MLKGLGIILVLFSGTMIGFYQSWQLASRPGQIRMLIQVLQHLETEIAYGLTPLPDALRTIGRKTASPVSGMLESVSGRLAEPGGKTTAEIWRHVFAERWGETSMKSVEKEIWLQFGSGLGISDREDQIKHIRLARQQLQMEEKRAAEDRERYGKMWKSLGVLAGMLAVILMY